MKKTLIAISAGLLAFGAAAEGNNSVTLYGVADAYVGSESVYQLVGPNAAGTQMVARRDRQAVVNSGGLSTSRVGIRVQEDLGNGMSAFAGYEQGLNLDKGTSAGNRRAVVGLSSELGSLSLGRQSTSYDSIIDDFDAQSDSGFSAINGSSQPLATRLSELRCFQSAAACTTADIQAVNDSGLAGRTGAFVGFQQRFSNSIRYDSPDFAGLSGSVTLGLGEDKGAGQKAALSTSVGLKYANGPLAVGLAHQEDQEQANGVTVVPAGSRVKLRNTLVAGSYDFGFARAHAGYNRAEYKVAGWEKQNEYFVGAVVPMDAFTLTGQVARSKGDTFGETTSVGGEVRYALSKRTTAYAGGNRTKLDHYTNSTLGFGVRHVF